MFSRQTTLALQAIKEVGIAQIRMEQLQNQLLDIVVTTISAAV